jgi:hypothetical protein
LRRHLPEGYALETAEPFEQPASIARPTSEPAQGS